MANTAVNPASSRLSTSKLANERAPARADGLPDGDLALAHARARQQQVGQVRTGDHQYEPGRGKKQPQRSFVLLAQLGDSGSTMLSLRTG